MRRLHSEIFFAVASEKLKEPFGAKEFSQAVPGWSPSTYKTFLAKHAKGNPDGNTELFVRVDRGKYLLDREKITA